MNNQQPWYYSWPVIIIAFLFFWPLGIVLIILKNRNKNASKQSIFMGSTNKKIYIIVGVILIIIGLSSTGDSGFLALFMLAGGIILIIYAEKMAKRGVRNKQYIDLIVNQQETSLDKIAAMCNVQYAIVVKELNQMKSLGVLKNATIDEMTRTVRIERIAPASPVSQLQGFTDSIASFGQDLQADVNVSNEVVVVACPGCGAKVSLRKGETVTCDYCDAPISAS